jgi:hypothetical protein
MARIWAKQETPLDVKRACATDLLEESVDADDDRAELSEEELAALEDAQVEEVTRRTAGGHDPTAKEKALLEKMMVTADAAGMEPDGRVRYLTRWIRENLLNGDEWNDKRVIIFTEYEDTLRYLRGCLEDATARTDNAGERIAVFHGPTSSDKREAIKLAFNERPSKNPLRILLCNDAAREGLNLQAHCYNLFHFDVPWNPSRLEQRNGRIDRELQPSDKVYCHYFVYTQRLEDRCSVPWSGKPKRSAPSWAACLRSSTRGSPKFSKVASPAPTRADSSTRSKGLTWTRRGARPARKNLSRPENASRS